MSERPQTIRSEQGPDGEIIETQVFPDGREITVQPMDIGDPAGPAYKTDDVMRILGFDEETIATYEQHWPKPE